jgi:activator of 2-hydroxyglutaryl-CoA dehydratase
MTAPVMMSGGVAKNLGVVCVLERLLGTEMILPPEPQIVGALGAALFAMDELKAKSIS